MNQQLFPQPAGIDGYQVLFSGCSVRELVRLETGNLVRVLNLVQVPSLAGSLSFQLTYNSRAASDNHGFGYGWVHDWMARIEPSSTAPVYHDETGRRFTFEVDGSNWKLDQSESLFNRIELSSLPNDEWRIQHYPDGDALEFDSNGRLVRRINSLGHSLEATYNGGGQLTQIQEVVTGISVGRTIALSYASNSITITDPRSKTYTLEYVDDNLVEVAGPEGCVLTFDYADPDDHLITQRIDPVPRDPEEDPLVDQSWNYTFNTSGALLSVTDSRGLTLAYEYVDDYQEYVSGPEITESSKKEIFRKTILTDADSQEWHYVFDHIGNLRRRIDPNGHQQRLFWSPQGNLLYEAAGFLNWDPYFYHTGDRDLLGPRDNPNMRFRRNVFDTRGNLLISLNANGLMNHYEYSQNRLVAFTPGRANFSVQGDWQGHYGSEGYVMCGATGSADKLELPAYISQLTKGTGSVAPATASFASTNAGYRDDFRCPRYRDDEGSLRRSAGYWRSAKDGSNVPYRRFQFTLEMATATNFNLSLYTCAVDHALLANNIQNYNEQYGYDLEILLTDSLGTHSFRLPNNGGGAWITFPVQPGEGDVLVELRARGNNNTSDLSVIGDAVLSALAFDPYEPRTTRLTYNSAGQVLTVTNPLGQSQVYTYNTDGTLASSQEPGHSEPTLYHYEDTYKNLTRVVDPLLGETVMTYDLNGNLLTLVDADERQTRFEYDDKNRLTLREDHLEQTTQFSYDAAGRLVQVEDALERITSFAYKHHRLWKVSDALQQNATRTYHNSGQLATFTDPRGKTTTLSYDPALQLVEVEGPDGGKVRYALDALGRVAAVTSPNGNQDNLEAINLLGAKNILFNPRAEEIREWDPNTYTTSYIYPRYWEPAGSVPRGIDSQGNAYFPIGTFPGAAWEQQHIPASAGGRYISSFRAREESVYVGDNQLEMAFVHRLHQDYPGSTHQLLESEIVCSQFEPTSSDWETSPRGLVEIPADIQASWRRPALASAIIRRNGGGSSFRVDQLQLQRISTCLEYDGENLREVIFPDGARQRVEFDRLGRAYLSRNPDGRILLRQYDALDRLVRVEDSAGNVLEFQYNAASDLVLFRLHSQGVDQDTTFSWDELHRLTAITYPDSTAESFEYSPAGDLISYEDPQERVSQFQYDALHRLVEIEYLTDSSTVSFEYDPVDNLTRQVERSGWRWDYEYDDLNRLVTARQFDNSNNLKAALAYSYNENGQRISVTPGQVYGTAVYGQSHYGQPGWSVPSGGRDDVGRLLAVRQKASDDPLELGYDIEGRLVSLTHAQGLQQLLHYDIVGKLRGIQVQHDSTELMKLAYGYTAGRDRISQHTESDTFDYLTDEAGRLVEEAHNRFCVHQPSVWRQGTWNQVSLDAENSTLNLLALNDDFAASELQVDRWKLHKRLEPYSTLGFFPGEYLNAGLEVRQQQGLHVDFPRAMANQALVHRAPVDNSIGLDAPEKLDPTPGNLFYPEVAPFPRDFQVLFQHLSPLQGDFDIAIDYQGVEGTLASGGGFVFYLMVSQFGSVRLDEPCLQVYYYKQPSSDAIGFYTLDNYAITTHGTTNPNSDSGELRLKRVGTTYTAYYRELGGSTWNGAWQTTNLDGDVLLELRCAYYKASMSIDISNFRHLDGKTHAQQGTWESPLYDAGSIVSWDALRWTENLPSGCDVVLEVAVADELSEFENRVSPPAYFGPSGPSSVFTTPGGEALPSNTTGRYARIRATLTGTGTATPSLSDIQLSCNSGSDIPSQVRRYRYDEAGNLLQVTTTTDSGTSTDLRDDPSWSSGQRLNALNQIQRQDVGGHTWLYTYSDSGALLSKTNGTDTWTYTWDPVEDRLLRVQGPGGVDVNLTYDMAGRMLTRTSGGVTTTFLWDGWDCIRESTPTSTTHYLIPEGQLLGFRRDGEQYSVASDALGCVRLVTDSSGTVVFRRDYGAFGETLPGGFDNIPGGMPYGFVGGLGVRTDADSGLIYMRQRWFDPTLQRFISRDPIGLSGGANLYEYAGGNPSSWNDPYGLDPVGSTGSGVGNSRLPRIPTTGGGDSIRRTPSPGSKPMNILTPAQLFLWLLMKSYGDARENMPAPGQGPMGPIPLPSPGPTPGYPDEQALGRPGGGRGKQKITHDWISREMQETKEMGEDECTWLRKKIQELEKTKCKTDADKKRLKDLEQQWKARCRGWRGTSFWFLMDTVA